MSVGSTVLNLGCSRLDPERSALLPGLQTYPTRRDHNGNHSASLLVGRYTLLRYRIGASCDKTCWVIMGGAVPARAGYAKVGGNPMLCCEGLFASALVLVLSIRGTYLASPFVSPHGRHAVLSAAVCRHER